MKKQRSLHLFIVEVFSMQGPDCLSLRFGWVDQLSSGTAHSPLDGRLKKLFRYPELGEASSASGGLLSKISA